MLKIFIKILAIFILAILQLALFSKFSFYGSVLNIILILAIALTLKNHYDNAFLLAFVGGIFLELSSPLRFGVFLVQLMGVVLLIHFVVLKFLPPPGFFVVFWVFAGSFILCDLFLALVTLSWPSWVILTNAFFNGLAGVLIFGGISRLIRPENEIKLI